MLQSWLRKYGQTPRKYVWWKDWVDYCRRCLESLSSSANFEPFWKGVLTERNADSLARVLAEDSNKRHPDKFISDQIWRLSDMQECGHEWAYDHLPIVLSRFQSVFYALYVVWRPSSRIIIPDNRRDLLRAMAVDESIFRVVSPRHFEELVAYVYECFGCRVLLTPQSRDFGADVLAWHSGPFDTETLIAIQVKRWIPPNKISLPTILQLQGSIAHYHANTGHVVTSSDFTKPARSFAERQGIELVNVIRFQAELSRLFRQ